MKRRPVLRAPAPVLVLVVALLCGCVCGCGGPRTAGDPAAGLPGGADPAAGRWNDWPALDWRFDRGILTRTYLFSAQQPDRPLDAYLAAQVFGGREDSLGLEDFLALDPDSRDQRRRAAAHHRDRAQRLWRSLDSLWNRMRDNPGAFVSGSFSEPEFLGDGVTMAIGHLGAAAGLDPSSAPVWYDLAVMYGAAGDVRRQDRALQAGLAALAAAGDPADPGQARLRRRLLLDRAWLLRDAGRFEECLDHLSRVMAMMREDAYRTPEDGKEALLIKGLALAGAGNVNEARQVANQLTGWTVPRRQRRVVQDSEAHRAIDKRNLEPVASDFDRRWIRATAFWKLGDGDQALAQLAESDLRCEFPAHLNFRFWNDVGAIQEHFGKMAESRISYALAATYRPLFIYHPMVGARGIARVYGQPGAGQLYFLGYRHFYLAGSLFSYAANRLVAMELATEPDMRRFNGDLALDAFDACLRRGIQPLSSLVLRGRVHYRRGDFTRAEADLTAAAAGLRAAGREDPDALLILGILHFNREDYPGAGIWLDRYTRLKPEEGLGWRLLGLALIHAGQLDKALAVMDHALEIEPDSAVGLYNRGLVHLKTGRQEAALADLEAARKLWPENPEITRVIDLLRDNPRSQVKLSHGEVDLRVSVADSAQFARTQAASPLNLVTGLKTGGDQDAAAWLGMDRTGAEYLLPELEARYRNDPTAANRAAYAWCLLQAERPAEVRDLLGPLWNRGIDPGELTILLHADRALGLPARAKYLALSLLEPRDPLQDPGFWELVAITCLESGERQAGLLAIDYALELDPANAGLSALRASP
ncbi:MAG: tetratricopeptide repeat protein [Candidatus Krumholzibacteriia bacterium]